MTTLTALLGVIRVSHDELIQRLIVGSIGIALAGGWFGLTWVGVSRSFGSEWRDLTLVGIPHFILYSTWLIVGLHTVWNSVLIVWRGSTQRVASGETLMEWEQRTIRVGRVWILMALFLLVYGIAAVFVFSLFIWHPWQISLSFGHQDLLQMSHWHVALVMPTLCIGEAAWRFVQRVKGSIDSE